MPTYDYRCDKCGDTFEIFQSMTEDPLTTHPDCGGNVTRIFAPVGISFKGSGFYKNDHGSRAGGSSKAKKDTGASATSSSGGDSASTSSDAGSSAKTGTKSDTSGSTSSSSASSSSSSSKSTP